MQQASGLQRAREQPRIGRTHIRGVGLDDLKVPGRQDQRRQALLHKGFHGVVGFFAVVRRHIGQVARRRLAELHIRPKFFGQGLPLLPIAFLGHHKIGELGAEGITHQRLQIDRHRSVVQKALTQRPNARVHHLALLPGVEEKRHLIPGHGEHQHIGALALGLDFLDHRLRVHTGFVFELGRHKAIPGIVLQGVVAQKIQDQREFKPVGPLVARVVQRQEAGQELGAAGLVVKNLVNVNFSHLRQPCPAPGAACRPSIKAMYAGKLRV